LGARSETPYQWTKQVASHWGGTRNGTIVHWPKGIKSKGQVRSQFHHVIHVAPTILEAAGLPQPVSVEGVQQKPIEGVSMTYSFTTRRRPSGTTQYFEMFGTRGIYHKGWTAVTQHKTPSPRPRRTRHTWSSRRTPSASRWRDSEGNDERLNS
jgi:arylsulfatase